MSGAISAVVVGAVGIAAGAYEYAGQHSAEEQALSLANTQNGRQTASFNQLQQLMANPGSFFSSPVYQAAFGQGTQAVERQQASGGFLNSGNEATALQAYGQSFGQQQLLGQEQLLASMSGASFNPASAVGTGSAAGSASFNQLGTLLAALGQSGSMMTGTGNLGTNMNNLATNDLNQWNAANPVSMPSPW